MSSQTPLETTGMGSLNVPRVWTGLWQLSGNAWGSASASSIRQSMSRHVEKGFTTFADHYGSAEILFGQFRNAYHQPPSVIGATKWCVFKTVTPTRQVVEDAVKERLRRMQCDKVDLLQLHWQNYSDHGYIEALYQLRSLKMSGLINEIGLCNFDAIHTDEVCAQLGSGFIVTNQVQFSLIDTRPLHGMDDVCLKHNVKLLTYGTLCGGFLSDHWLNKEAPYNVYAGDLTPSQRKYLDVILKAWGDWELFQELLRTLRTVGDRHGRVSISNIATRWVLDHSFVGAVIIGGRLGLAEHPDDNIRVFTFSMTEQDREDINGVLERSNSSRLITIMGDCGSEYR